MIGPSGWLEQHSLRLLVVLFLFGSCAISVLVCTLPIFRTDYIYSALFQVHFTYSYSCWNNFSIFAVYLFSTFFFYLFSFCFRFLFCLWYLLKQSDLSANSYVCKCWECWCISILECGALTLRLLTPHSSYYEHVHSWDHFIYE